MAGTTTGRALGELGAIARGGSVEFRVWAPAARSLALQLGDRTHELERGDEGTWWGEVAAVAGDDYRFLVDGQALADPCSRAQPGGLDGPSQVVDTAAFGNGGFAGVALEDLVLYELHVGTFSAEGTFDGAIPHLATLVELGITAIELMPVATFPGTRNWGYDGVYSFAPHPAYGGPPGLARLVAAAHAVGLGVLLDVVYNHVGPGNHLTAFGPYFTDARETFWGDALDYTRPGVREWAIQNAELWIRDYRLDGLRLDAVHAIYDDSPTHVLAELAARVKSVNPRALVTSEMEIGDWRPIEEWGHDAQWADRSHHVLHTALTGERDGYYADHAESLRELPWILGGEGHRPEQLVVCAQNHDQVGNRALGDRLPPDALRVAAAITLFSPCTPLLFMGEEYGEPNPFQFFTDHTDPLIADATRAGRREEFASFAAFSGADVPDPQAEETFRRSKLSRRADEATRSLYERLLRLRRELPRETAIAVEDKTVRMRRGDVELVADLQARTVSLHE